VSEREREILSVVYVEVTIFVWWPLPCIQARSQEDASRCSAPITNLDAPTRNLQNIKDKQLISARRNVRPPWGILVYFSMLRFIL
jgi:hypothetical protein